MDSLVKGLLEGKKRDCARLISIVENESKSYENYLKEIYKYTGKTYVIGITGPPGAGKSTFTDKIVKLILKENKKVGIIAIDPTSPFTKGSILGDRIRMSDLSTNENVFIRSMGSRGSLGGISNATKGVINILDAYGCDYIFIETVGVGQSEIDIVKIADTTVVVMVPGLGDDIQAIKAGIMEIGDIFVVNKADKDGAKKTLIEIQSMLDLKKNWGFKPLVNLSTSYNGTGVDITYKNILIHKDYLEKNNKLNNIRLENSKLEVSKLVQKKIINIIEKFEEEKEIKLLLQKTTTKEIDPYTISDILYKKIRNE